jgi:hypothetical protein
MYVFVVGYRCVCGWISVCLWLDIGVFVVGYRCVCGWISVCLWLDIGVFSRIFLCCPCSWPYGCCAIMLIITNWSELKTTTTNRTSWPSANALDLYSGAKHLISSRPAYRPSSTEVRRVFLQTIQQVLVLYLDQGHDRSLLISLHFISRSCNPIYSSTLWWFPPVTPRNCQGSTLSHCRVWTLPHSFQFFIFQSPYISNIFKWNFPLWNRHTTAW